LTLRPFAGALLAMQLAGCASMQTQGARAAGVAVGGGHHGSNRAGANDASPMNQAELQQALQRSAAQFQSRIGQVSIDALQHAGIERQELILRQALLYQSSVLDIATGPEPEVNLLDMVVFAELSAAVVKTYWTSERLGDASRGFSDAFESLERDVRRLVDRVLSPEQRALLERLIDDWLAQNPHQRLVEGVRLVGFGRVAGDAADERGNAARGLLSSVKSATRAADRALLLAERALFLSQRVPFLLRAHARLGAREVTGDTRALLDDMDALLQRSADLRPMIAETSALLGRVADVTERVRMMSRELDPMLERAIDLANDDQLEKHLATADLLSGRALSIMTQLERLQQTNASALAQLTPALDALVRRWIGYLALAGAACVLLYWVCYYAVKRLSAAS
jgi:hypothetical protein